MDDDKMIKGQDAPEAVDNKKKPAGRSRAMRILRRTVKTVLWTAFSLVALIALALGLVVWILTPEKLTPIVERIANENLDAEVKIGRVELTVWKTFPMASIDIQDLRVRSGVLGKYGDTIPAYADSLLDVGRLRAEVNIAKIPLMRFDVKEILIDSPKINAVMLNDSVSNFMIFPPSEPDTAASAVTIMPDVVIHKFSITGNRGIRFADLSRRMDVTLRTDSVELGYNRSDHFYSLLLKGGVFADLPDYHVSQNIPFYFKGDVNWNTKNPYKCTLRGFRAEVARVPASIDADVALSDSAVSVKALEMSLGPVRYADLTEQVPKEYLLGLERIKTNFAVSVKMKLDKPFVMGRDKEPSFHAEISIPNCYIQPGRYADYRINKLNLDARLAYNGDNPDRSTLSLNRLLLDGFGINLSASGTASNLLKDPAVNGKVSGGVDFAKLLKLIPKELPMRLSGKMDMNTTMKFALSDLDVTTFHKMQVNGEVDFSNVRYTVPKDSMLVFLKRAKIKFGTNSEFQNQAGEMKNILMASVSLDSTMAAVPGLMVAANGVRFGAGSLGTAADLMDTTNITPIGARFKIGQLTMMNRNDSSMFRMRNLESNGSIKRYRGAERLPLFDFGIKADMMRYRDRTTIMSLRKGDIELQANMKPKRVNRRMRRIRARIDSLCSVHPELSRDSVVAMYVARFAKRRGAEQINDDEFIDLSVDNKLKRLLNRWNFEGSLSAKRGMLFTPYFPLRNILRDVDMDFNLDEFNIRSLKYRVGNSDLAMKGKVSNIKSTLMGVKRRPLTVDFDVYSDTLDVNQLMKALYRGTAFSADTSAAASFNFASADNGDEESMQAMVEESTEDVDTTVKHAVIIPKNVAISLKVRDKFARYSTLDLSDLRGDLNINKGVLSLRNLAGKAEGGQLRLDLVYASADKEDIGMGLYLDLNDIQVGRFLKMMPGVDTIMPMLKGVDGVINARLGVTTKIDSLMNIITPTTNAALHIDGKELVLLDSETFRKISKMLLFKNKEKNMIDSLSVEVAAYDSQIDIYPFILNMDRYKLGVMGTNDFDMNYDFHVSILKSPIPFKFGVNISGNADDMKIRLGKAKLKENEVARTTMITDTTKVNLFKQMDEMFRRGAEAALRGESLNMYRTGDRSRMRRKRQSMNLTETRGDTISRADSLKLIEEGIIERPDTIAVGRNDSVVRDEEKANSFKERRNKRKSIRLERQKEALKPENN